MLVCRMSILSAVYERLLLLVTGKIDRRANAGIQITQGSIMCFLAPQERHVAPMMVKFGIKKRCAILIKFSEFVGSSVADSYF